MKDCTGCKYENQPSSEYPCNQCVRNPNDIFDEYVPKEDTEGLPMEATRDYIDASENFTTDPNYKEILVLDKMLTSSGIPHTLKRLFDGWQIYYPAEDDRVMDAIEHFGSYGNDEDLLEIMGLLTPEEEERDSVLGYLTAKEVFDRIERDWKGRTNQ